MAFIKMIDEEKAEGKLKKIYETIVGKNGIMANVLKIQSLNPDALKAHYDFYKVLIHGKSALSRAQREMIATIVSVQNQCHY